MPRVWGQGVGLSLRPSDVRIVQRILQEDRAEQEGVHVCGGEKLSHRQDTKETVSLLQIPEVLGCGHETRR